jgi:hypothetical protein
MEGKMKYFKLNPVRDKLRNTYISLGRKEHLTGTAISNGVKIIGLVWVVGSILACSNVTYARIVRETSYNMKELINSKRPLTEGEIKFIVSKIRIRGLSLKEVAEKFFIFDDGTVYLDWEKLNEFVNSPKFEIKPKSYPLENIGATPESFIDFLENLLKTTRWQILFPDTFKEEKYGKFGVIIALTANIFYIREIGKFLLFDPLESGRSAIVRPLILGNLFISGLGRVDGEYKGKYYRVIDDEEGEMIVRLEGRGLSKSGRAYIEEVYIKEDEGWIRWRLGRKVTGFVSNETELGKFLNTIVENNPYRRY